MRSGVDYYAVLGVPRSVTSEDLKRRYRQLVRNHHPDVADDPDQAHERFIRIVEAYRTLSEPALRRAYDAVQATAPPPVLSRSAQVTEQLEDWFRHAVHRLEEGDLNGAAAHCRKILSLDEHHAAAQAMLGDIHVQREEWDQALVCFSNAVSAAPRNPAYARKLRQAAESGQQARAAAERREHVAQQHQRAVEALNARHELAPYLVVLAATWLLLLTGWAVTDPGPATASWFALPWHFALAAVGSGLGLGLALGVSPAPAGGGQPDRRFALLSVLLGVASAGQFYLGVAAYVVLSFIRERLIPPLTAAFAVSFVWVVVLAALSFLAPGPGGEGGLWLPTAAWSGNLVFPALLVGLGLARLGLRPTG